MDHCKAFMEPGLRSCDAPHLVRQTLALEVDKCGWCGTWQSSLFSNSHFKIGNVRMGCPFREGQSEMTVKLDQSKVNVAAM
jgi:hypothetical protein